MSRFSSGRQWSALDVQEGESSDSEPEIVTPVEPVAPIPSKASVASKAIPAPPVRASSKKRAKKAAQAAAKAQQPQATQAEEPPNQPLQQPQSQIQDPGPEQVQPPEHFAINDLASKVIPTPHVNGSLDTSVVSSQPAPVSMSSSSGRATSPLRPVNTAIPFAPQLPDDLPHTTSPGLGPRKRKASDDLKSSPFPKDAKVDWAPETKDDGAITNGAAVNGSHGAVDQAVVEKTAGLPTDGDHERRKKLQRVVTRVIWTLVMIFGFFFCLAMGPVYMIILVLGIQTQVYREVTNLFGFTSKSKDVPTSPKKKQRDPWSKTLNWYFFAITNYFLYGETMIHWFKHVIHADVRFLPFATNHRFISFMLYMFGFMGFVASLKKQFLRQQFGLFGWVHMSLLIIVVSSHFIIDNILEGMVWFWVPASLVICNDIFAYIWGMTIGKTPLIALSPKKTVEGFVGAFFTTVIFAYWWATFFMRFPYMTCPATDLGANVFANVQCEPISAFVWRTYTIPASLQTVLSPFITIPPIPWAPFQLHALVMATFASLVAPFGGFFASGFKRAFDLKDFGDSIPGHGGLTDRMDCQFIMGMFAYVYYSSIVRTHQATPASVMQAIRSSLTAEEQLLLIKNLKDYLVGMGLQSNVTQALL